MFHKLKKLGFLNNIKEWMYLEDKRNIITYQYNEEPFEMTQAINDILQQKAIYVKIKHKMQLR